LPVDFLKGFVRAFHMMRFMRLMIARRDNRPSQRLGLTNYRPSTAGTARTKWEARLARFVALLAALAAVAAVFAQAKAGDDYPNRPIALVIPLPPGGTNDIMARAVADKMSAALGQRIVVENRNAGGSGTVGTREVAHAAPDGYTIILGYTSTLATGPHLYKDVGYDARKDLAPIGLIASAPALLLVYRDFPAHNVGELIAMMKSAKEPVQVATPGAGTVNYLASILFAQQAGVKVEQIVEKGSNPLITDMMGGFVKVGFNPIPVSRAALDGGLIRALAVTSAKHSTLMPQLPTLAESGLPGFDATLSYGLLAPAGTPKPIIDRLNKELRAALADDDVKKRIINEGGEPSPTSPEEHAAVIDREDTKWSAVIRDAGIEPQ
jgi:tripartite-type tricarboxylate transporter receptor subunit TctC